MNHAQDPKLLWVLHCMAVGEQVYPDTLEPNSEYIQSVLDWQGSVIKNEIIYNADVGMF